MDIRRKFVLNIPKNVIDELRLTEDTIFVVSYIDGKLTVEPIVEEDDQSQDCIESENDAWYEEGYEEGLYDGYIKGYSAGYDDGENGHDFDDTFPDEVGYDCDYDCNNCSYYNPANDTCEAPDGYESETEE